MLSRTADNLFWLARYMERADFLARIIEASQRLAALPDAHFGDSSEWESALESSGASEGFHDLYKTADEASVVDYLAFSTANPSSIHNCIVLARVNARAVRTALTAEMWEAINSAWIEMVKFESCKSARGVYDREQISHFLGFVKRTSIVFDGSAYRTMLRNDAYWISQLGLHIERADNTARLLDVKYHVLLPEAEAVGGSLDYFQWTTILRAVSALTAYHWIYRQSVRPWLVADLLILKREMPRSLISCYENIVLFLDSLSAAHGQQGPAQRQARDILSRLEYTTIEAIFQNGMHEFITAFVDDNNRMSVGIADQYLLV